MDLRRKNVINGYISDLVDKTRMELKKQYPDFETFNGTFSLDDTFMKGFFDHAEKEGIKLNEEQYKLSEKLIKSQLKSLIAQKLWDLNEMYVIINDYDNEVQKAVDVISDDKLFTKMKIDH
jgi:carboxyl-terminal processing protease